MQVWISYFATTRGIFEAEVEPPQPGHDWIYLIDPENNYSRRDKTVILKKYWHTAKEEARRRALLLITRHRAELKKKLAELNKIARELGGRGAKTQNGTKQ